MKHFSTYIIGLLLLSATLSCRTSRDLYKKDLHALQSAPWEATPVDASITWRHYTFPNLFDTLENINVLDIDLSDTTLRPAVIFQPTVLSPTHELAASQNALVAVNGNFFHTKEGGSVCFLKVGGKIIDTSRTDLPAKLFLDELDDAAFTMDASGRIAIRLCPPQGWKSLDALPTILSGGPPLLIGKKPVALIHLSFNDHRFSRTGVGLTSRHHLLLITVDGHSPRSGGVSMNEFRTIFRSFGCTDAMNLDGGGSTTMWIRGQPFDGIVNYPTDNKKYDHTGERKIANILAVIRR